jgi:hypothetical protein
MRRYAAQALHAAGSSATPWRPPRPARYRTCVAGSSEARPRCPAPASPPGRPMVPWQYSLQPDFWVSISSRVAAAGVLTGSSCARCAAYRCGFVLRVRASRSSARWGNAAVSMDTPACWSTTLRPLTRPGSGRTKRRAGVACRTPCCLRGPGRAWDITTWTSWRRTTTRKKEERFFTCGHTRYGAIAARCGPGLRG